jgi:hypothetical protein
MSLGPVLLPPTRVSDLKTSPEILENFSDRTTTGHTRTAGRFTSDVAVLSYCLALPDTFDLWRI